MSVPFSPPRHTWPHQYQAYEKGAREDRLRTRRQDTLPSVLEPEGARGLGLRERGRAGAAPGRAGAARVRLRGGEGGVGVVADRVDRARAPVLPASVQGGRGVVGLPAGPVRVHCPWTGQAGPEPEPGRRTCLRPGLSRCGQGAVLVQQS
ncbi:hypothetical protein THAOC_29623 [Thalassiosira oceanica]|uniref:Uncharacterized protein n=1 Tax=Thalassiosira oceanica TaxID=159749 RepID=K0RG38_THAOC|nr:hypothetical protein THAOC_29623 [Thalassiosira oceanica]|eukprot:EJK51224.1 hypothetical protein THAOC_29623 [Thalassiosira oceanica]